MTLALSVACAAAEDPEEGGAGPGGNSGGSASGGSAGSLAGAGTAGRPSTGSGGSVTGASGSPSSSSGSGSGGTSSQGGTPATTGGTPAGTAGTPATTGGTSAGTCPPYTGTLAMDSLTFMGGFGKSTVGTWTGYGFTYTYGTATITPGKGNGCFAGAKFCAAGTVPASTSAGAALGWNIAQKQNETTAATVAITSPVTISYAGVTAGMRVQLTVSDTVSYCYPLTAMEASAKTATIAPASFKTDCWGTAGTAYAGAAIASIQLVVPGGDAAQTFDFCITDIEPG